MCLNRKPVTRPGSRGDRKRCDESWMRIIEPEVTAMKRRDG